MKFIISRTPIGLAALLMGAGASAQGTIGDYLFAHNAGPVAANDIIGVSKSAISDLQTPRDLALSLGSFGDRNMQQGFGLSFTPARSGFNALAVSANKYQDDWMRRLWGGTTVSYAQNRKTISGADYNQSAFALSLTVMLDPREDPIVVAYRALAISQAGEITCKVQQEMLEAEARKERQLEERLYAEFKEKNNQREPSPAELEQIKEKAKASADAARSALADLKTCADKAAAEKASKWNASRLQLMLGKGSITPVAGAGESLRLAAHVKLSVALGVGADGLVNFTWRHAGHELDLASLSATPSFKTTRSAALRYTYKAGTKGDMFAIAEASNVKASVATVSQSDFKQALGIDKMIVPGLWLEFRYGRATSALGGALENKGLFSLKFSEDKSLEKLVKK